MVLKGIFIDLLLLRISRYDNKGKDVYEDFVRERVEEERREKRNRMKEKKDDFRRLMEDAKLNGK